MSPAALTAARALYLPIVSAYMLAGPVPSPAQRERLIRRIEAALRSEDQVAAWSLASTTEL